MTGCFLYAVACCCDRVDLCEACSWQRGQAAYHMACLRSPLAHVPEGEWFCEACEEKRAVGGTREEAARMLPQESKRWLQRVLAVRCCSQLSMCAPELIDDPLVPGKMGAR